MNVALFYFMLSIVKFYGGCIIYVIHYCLLVLVSRLIDESVIKLVIHHMKLITYLL